jgi:hypothetical protein
MQFVEGEGRWALANGSLAGSRISQTLSHEEKRRQQTAQRKQTMETKNDQKGIIQSCSLCSPASVLTKDDQGDDLSMSAKKESLKTILIEQASEPQFDEQFQK